MAIYLGNRLVLANGVAGTSLANGHGETHATGGGDEITPQAIGAAAYKTDWKEYTSTCTQTVGVSGMRSSKYAIVGPVPLDWGVYTEANIRCSVQGYNSLTFSADKIPNGDVDVNVLIWG